MLARVCCANGAPTAEDRGPGCTVHQLLNAIPAPVNMHRHHRDGCVDNFTGNCCQVARHHDKAGLAGHFRADSPEVRCVGSSLKRMLSSVSHASRGTASGWTRAHMLYHYPQVLDVDTVDAADITPDAFWQRYAVRPCTAHTQYCRTATVMAAFCNIKSHVPSCSRRTDQYWSAVPCPRRWGGAQSWTGARLRSGRQWGTPSSVCARSRKAAWWVCFHSSLLHTKPRLWHVRLRGALRQLEADGTRCRLHRSGHLIWCALWYAVWRRHPAGRAQPADLPVRADVTGSVPGFPGGCRPQILCCPSGAAGTLLHHAVLLLPVQACLTCCTASVGSHTCQLWT